jgi:DtxR family Mn-dependent transcriptional regulator
MSQEHATPAEEEYLQIIYWLMEAELPITGANIARAMRLAPPTVHEMLGRLEQDGYVTRDEDRSLRFTESGLQQAEAIVGRHRLIERFLTDVVGIAWDDVHEEAEKLEHAMSPAFEQWMITAVGDAKTCPHGHPIEPGKRIPGVPLADVAVGAEVEVLRFENEAEDLLHYLKSAGMAPGLKGTLAESNGDEVILRSNGDAVSVTRSVAETVSVRAEPSPPPRTALPEQLVLGKDRYGR